MSKADLKKTKAELVQELDRLRRKLSRLERQGKSAPARRSSRERELEARFRALFDQLPIGLFISEKDGSEIQVNTEVARMMGYETSTEVEDLVRELGVAKVFYSKPSDRPRLVDQLESQGSPWYSLEVEAKRRDGTPFEALLTVGARPDPLSGSPALFGFLQDITERKEIERDLRESAEFNRQIIDSAQDGIVVYGPDLKYQVWNPAMERQSGRKDSEVLGRHPLEVFPFLREAGVIERLEEALTHGKTSTVEFPFEYPSTSRSGWVLDASGPLRDAEGRIVGVIGVVKDITDRKEAELALARTEAELRASEGRFRDIVENAGAGYFRIDGQGKYASVNEAWLRMHKYDSADEVIGRRFTITQTEDDLEAAATIMEHLIDGEPCIQGDFSRLNRDGSVGWHSFSSRPVIEGGKITGIEGFLIDSTETRESQQKLMAHFEQQRLISELAREFVNVPVGKIDEAIDAALGKLTRFVGAVRGAVFLFAEDLATIANTHEWCSDPADSRISALAEIDAERFSDFMERLKNLETVFANRSSDLSGPAKEQFRSVEPKGFRPVLLVPLIQQWKLQGAIGVMGAGGTETDWSTDHEELLKMAGYLILSLLDRKRMERRIAESLTFNQKVLDSSTVGILVYRADGRCISANQAAAGITGGTIGSLLQQNFHDLDSWERSGMIDFAREALASGKVSSREARFQSSFGQEVWGEIKFVPFMSAGERHLLVMVLDIRDRKLAEQAYERSKEQLELLFENMEEGFSLQEVIVDEQGQAVDYRHLVANAAFERHSGLRREEALGRTIYEIRPQADPKVVNAFCRAGLTGQPFEREYFSQTFNRYLKVRAMSSSPGIFATIFEDITDRKLLEIEQDKLRDQLVQSQKMDAIGNLAGGIAHDFNNLLTGILGYANLLRLELPPDSPEQDAARTIEKAAERARELTAQLLGFARRGKHQVVPTNLHDVIGEIVKMLSRTVDKQIKLTTFLHADPPVIKGDPGQMQQMLMNLAVNAADAMPAGGELTFRTEVNRLEKEDLTGREGVSPGEFLSITISDTGRGIPEKDRSRIFEPFYTTKERGKGTGMGLAVVYGIAANHGGYVEVRSAEGQGSSFIVHLPLAREAQMKKKESAPGPAADRVTGTVLLVDDEPVVRKVAAAMLAKLGYRVVTAENGREAVQVFRERSAEIDLVILDMIMPEMGGGECFQLLKEINPRVKALLSTGYEVDGQAQAILDQGVGGFLQKPYEWSALAAEVERVIKKTD